GPHDELVMVGPVAMRDLPRQLELAEGLFGETDRERPDRMDTELVHQGDDRPRVEAAGEEDAERHVAHQVTRNRAAERVDEVRLPLPLAALLALRGVAGERPVALHAHAAFRLGHEDRSRLELARAGEDGRRIGYVAEGQI